MPFVLPGGILIPLLAAGAIVWLLSQATLREATVEAWFWPRPRSHTSCGGAHRLRIGTP